MVFRRIVQLVIVFGLLLPSAALAQELSRNNPKIVALFAPVVERSRQSVVLVQCNGRDVALGTVVAADGWILTRSSELSSKAPACRCQGGKTYAAVVVAEDERYDLALLKVEANDMVPVEWSDSKVTPVGRWVCSPALGEWPVAIGVISVASRDITGAGATRPNPNSGFLGVNFDPEFAGVKLLRVEPNSPAHRSGLKAEDQILAVNGEAVGEPGEFSALIQRHKPGDVLMLKILRQEKESELRVTLGKRPQGSNKYDTQNSWGSQLSQRRTGIPTILQHDQVLRPSDCGGPLVDLQGRVIGINIARAGRTESHAIPGEVVKKLLSELMSKEKNATGTNGS
jgi:serine protease Do